MREIKFRAWDFQAKYMLGGGGMQMNATTGELAHLPSVIVMQWTGLMDKQGKEIYEGDITCRHWDDGTWQNGLIIWDEAGFLWQEIGGKEPKRIAFIHPIGINTKHSEVIGNIYENPELLKGELKDAS